MQKSKEKRYNPETLMRAIHKMMVDTGNYSEFEPIIDYFLPDDYHPERLFKSYGFDIFGIAEFGGSEGIYVGIYAEGVTDDSGESNKWHLGTYKTLGTQLSDMQAMGKLAGTIVYYGSKFVNEHLSEFE